MSHGDPRPSPSSGLPHAWLPDVERRRLTLRSGVEIALLDWGGEGPLALLHHANGFCAGVWGVVAEGLRGRYRLFALDARGHGDSTRPEGPDAYHWDRFAEDAVEVAEILADELGASRFALGLGHSLGGTTLLGAAARRTRLFGRLVMVDPVTPLPERAAPSAGRHPRTARLARGARRRRQVFASREEARARWSSRTLFANWDPRVLDLYAVHGLRERADGRVELKCPGEVEATIFENGSLDVAALARRVRTPSLWLWARRGDFRRQVYERLARSMRAGRVEDVDAGHLVPMERPDLVVDAVERFAGAAAVKA